MFRTHKATLCVTLAALMAFSPSVALAQQAGSTGEATTSPARKLNLTYVTPGTFATAVVHPRRLLTAPEMQMLPVEVASAAGKQELGIDPAEIDQVMALIEAPQDRTAPPAFGIVVRFTRAYDLGSILQPLQKMTEPAMFQGKAYRRGVRPDVPSLFMPDDRTLILAQEGMFQKMLAQETNQAPGPMSQALAAMDDSDDAMAVVLLDPLRPMIREALRKGPPPPGPLAGLVQIPDMIAKVEARVKLTGTSPRMLLSLHATDETAAAKLQTLIDFGLMVGQQMMMAQMAKDMARSPNPNDPVQQAAMRYAQRLSERMFKAIRPERVGNRLELATQTQNPQQAQLTNVAVIGVLVALLLPAVQAAREAARRAKSLNNMKQLGLSMHIYHDKYKHWPTSANYDAQGKPLLSWRVHILPYLDQEALYKQFHLDEPWDSPHNKKLIPLMPEVFRNPSSTAEPGESDYLMPVGPGLISEGQKKRSIRDIRDGTSNTIAMLEVDPDKAVIWTKPEDWNYDPNNPLSGLGKAHPGVFNALFMDGHVSSIAAGIDAQVFHALLTIAGGEAIGNIPF
ncbi:MAG: DUF1559 domain-containing protein [Pirellulales bacterium]|nr:DUF1559 domain-containing protein [Pirellulales bacterium]